VNILKDALAGSPDNSVVTELANTFSTDPTATRDALAHVVDEISRRMERLTLSRGGLADLVRAVGDSHHEAYLKDQRLIGSPAMDRDGKAILDHVFWTKDRSRGVAARAAQASGLPADKIEDMLPTMAALSMAELTQTAAGPFDEILRRIPGLDDALKEMQREGRGGASGGFDRLPGAGKPTDIGAGRPSEFGPQGSGGIPEQAPLPIPGENLPFPDRGGSRYDDLSDILRRGGFRIPGGSRRVELPDSLPGDINLPGNIGGTGGGLLYNIFRAVLGALLGFKSRGILSWLIRLIVLRWGWGFIQRTLGRVLGRVLQGR
jgi:hypothetical protein